MEEQVFLLKAVKLLFGLDYFYSVTLHDSNVSFQGRWHKGLIRSLLNMGAKLVRFGGHIELRLIGCRFVFFPVYVPKLNSLDELF